MRLTGKEILESQQLQKFLLDNESRVLCIVWHDGSVSSGIGKDIYVGKIDESSDLYVIEGLWSEKIRDNIILDIEEPNNDLYRVYTTTEASLLWGKEESTIRKAISNGKFVKWIEYRKAGRITLITKSAMQRVYGELE